VLLRVFLIGERNSRLIFPNRVGMPLAQSPAFFTMQRRVRFREQMVSGNREEQ
jgi:hypothetical protein